VVIDSQTRYYSEMNSNVHRGVHYLSDLATRAYEQSRETVRNFLHAKHTHEVLFTRGTTDAINILSQSMSRGYLLAGDEIILSGMEHHSNIVPWQLIAQDKGLTLKVIPVNELGELETDKLPGLITPRTRLITLNHVSNTLGTINPVAEIIALAHSHDIPVMLDGAQAVAHMQVDVQALDVDFYAFSGHKIFGPTGIGVLYGKEAWLNRLPPADGGGDMIKTVTFEKTTWNELPFKFEAGTPNIAGVIGLDAAIRYVTGVGLKPIGLHEQHLLRYATDCMKQIPGMRIIGEAAQKAAVISFLIGGSHPSDLGTLLDMEGIAIRTGHHCTQPLMQRFGVTATARASFSVYNTMQEVDTFISGLEKALNLL
jgi:cysteine desulfurase/selenocysteine lyase